MIDAAKLDEIERAFATAHKPMSPDAKLYMPALAGQELLAFAREALALRAENDRLRQAFADKLASETLLTDLVAERGGITIGMQGGACQLFADFFADQLIDSGAENYIEATFGSRRLPPGESLVVTLRRCTGKTPHQLRREAEQREIALRAAVEAHNAGCTEACDARQVRTAYTCGQFKRTSKGRCPDCPRLDMIDVPERAKETGGC